MGQPPVGVVRAHGYGMLLLDLDMGAAGTDAGKNVCKRKLDGTIVRSRVRYLELGITLPRGRGTFSLSYPRQMYAGCPMRASRLGLWQGPKPKANGEAPWHARTLTNSSLITLASGGRRLYAITNDNRLVRLSARAGRVVAVSPIQLGDDGAYEYPVRVGGLVWTITAPKRTSAHRGTARLIGSRPDSLATAVDRVISWRGRGDVSVLAGRHRQLYAAVGRTVVRLAPGDGSVITRTTMPGPVSALAVQPNGTAVWVAYGPQGNSTVQRVDSTSLSATAPPVAQDGGVYQLAASDAGVFITMGFGMSDNTEFVRPGHRPVTVTTGGGGVHQTVSIGKHVAWSGGPNQLVCADSRTGSVRVQTPLPQDGASFGSVAMAGGALFATYLSSYNAKQKLVRLTPPNACRVRN